MRLARCVLYLRVFALCMQDELRLPASSVTHQQFAAVGFLAFSSQTDDCRGYALHSVCPNFPFLLKSASDLEMEKQGPMPVEHTLRWVINRHRSVRPSVPNRASFDNFSIIDYRLLIIDHNWPCRIPLSDKDTTPTSVKEKC